MSGLRLAVHPRRQGGRGTQRLPRLEVGEVRLPGKADDPVVVMGRAGAVLARDRGKAVRFDPATGALLSAVGGGALNLHQRIAEAADPLHFRTFGEALKTFLWFVLGLTRTTRAVSGALPAVHADAFDAVVRAACRPRALVRAGSP